MPSSQHSVHWQQRLHSELCAITRVFIHSNGRRFIGISAGYPGFSHAPLYKQVTKLRRWRIAVPRAAMWMEITLITKDGLRGG